MKFFGILCYVLGMSYLSTEGCDIVFLAPKLDDKSKFHLTIREKTPAYSEIQIFRAECRNESTKSPVKFYVEGKDAESFVFNNSVLTNKRLIRENPGSNFSVIVLAVNTEFSDRPRYRGVNTDITVVEYKELKLAFTPEELHSEIFRGVAPGTVVWSVSKQNLTVSMPVLHTYSEAFEVTSNFLSIATVRSLTELPAKVQIPISLISTDPSYKPITRLLTIELQPISQPEVLTAVAVNTSYADVCWKVPDHGPVSKYQLHVVSDNISVISDVFPTSDQVEVCAKVHSLILNQAYTFQVRGVFGSVRSPPSGTYFYTHVMKGLATPLGIACLNGGQMIRKPSGRYCSCPLNFSGQYCETSVVAFCSNSTVVDVKGVFRWPSTPFGHWSYIDCPTSSNQGIGLKKARRFCSLDLDNVAHWFDQDASDCSKAALTRDSVTEIIAAIQRQDTEAKQSVALTKMAEVLSETADFAAKDKTLTKEYIRAVDNLLTAEPQNIQQNETNTRIVETFEKFLGSIELKERDSIKLELPNIKVDVREVPKTDVNDGIQYVANINTDIVGDVSQVTSSIKLPKEVFSKLNSSSYRVAFVLYADSKLFPVNKDANYSVERVLLAAVNEETISGLKDCVQYSLPKTSNDQVGGVYKCAYWDVTKKQWSYTGVTKQGEDETSVHCCSDHLTNFAVLLDVDPNVVIDEKHNDILGIITYVGSGLSITGLTLTLITYALFPCLRRNKSGQILLHLASSMLLMHVLFLIGGSDVIVEYREICRTVAILLHYLVLTTLIWMGIEAFNLYRLLVKVFAMYEKHFLLKRALAGWGIPAIFLIVAMAVDLDNYSDQKINSCRLSHKNIGLYYGTYIGPVCLVLFCNLVVFVILLKVLIRPRFDNSLGKRTVTGAQIRGVMSVLVLLGISWIFGAVAIGEAKLVMQYMFVITTSLQGFCIFIFRSLRNFEAQSAWRQLWYEGTFKTRRGPIIKHSLPTHTTSTMSGDERNKTNRSEKRPISETEESLSRDNSYGQVYEYSNKLSQVSSEKGTFWLNKYRRIMGLEKCTSALSGKDNIAHKQI